MNIIEKLAASGHLTAEQVERIGKNVHDFLDAIDRDPALYKEAMEKIAGLGDMLGRARRALGGAADQTMKYVPMALATAGAGALMGGAVEAGRTGIRSLREGVDKSRAYKSMLEENPHLSDADPSITEKAFNTLYRFNPHYAQDPLVAGTFVKNVIDQERMDIGTVSNLVQANKAISDSKPRGGGMPEFFMKSMQGAVRPGGGSESGGGGAFGPHTGDVAQAVRDAANRMGEAAQEQRDFFRNSEQVSADDPRVRR